MVISCARHGGRRVHNVLRTIERLLDADLAHGKSMSLLLESGQARRSRADLSSLRRTGIDSLIDSIIKHRQLAVVHGHRLLPIG